MGGGGGFLGSHVRMRLAARSDEKVVLVARCEPALPLTEREVFISAANFGEEAGLAPLREAHSIIYLAATSTVATFVDRPWSELDENVAPLMRLAKRLVRENAQCRLIFTSSGGTIYGRAHGVGPIAEDQPCRPISAYGLGKLMAEQALQFFARTEGLDFRILRVSNPVGRFARSTTQGLVSVAMNAIISGRPITLFGDGSNVRDLVDADDVADALIMSCFDTDWHGATWNIGSGAGISNREVLELVGRITGKPVPLELAPARPQDVPAIVLDCRKASRELGWHPSRALDQTVAELWASRAGIV